MHKSRKENTAKAIPSYIKKLVLSILVLGYMGIVPDKNQIHKCYGYLIVETHQEVQLIINPDLEKNVVRLIKFNL